MIADFQSELRRIREVPSAPTVNIWVSNQTPEELLEILKRIPDRPAGDGNGRDGVQALLHAENPVATAANQAGDPKSDVQAAKTPHRPEKPAPNGNPRLQRRVYEGVYQCDTGRINADSGGEGKWVIRDAKYVKLSKEEERELERRDSKDGYKDGEPKKRL